MITRSLVTLALLALSGRLVAQDTARLGGRLDSATQAIVLRSVDSARSRGLPVDPLVDKALEGATKRAAGPRIQAAVSALLRRLELARDALAPNPGPRDIAAGADALAYGATREALATMRATVDAMARRGTPWRIDAARRQRRARLAGHARCRRPVAPRRPRRAAHRPQRRRALVCGRRCVAGSGVGREGARVDRRPPGTRQPRGRRRCRPYDFWSG